MENKEGRRKDIDHLIQAALKKIGGKKENDICHYLPGKEKGYIHHFTMQKIKSTNPDQLATMINHYILDKQEPQPLPPKQRASRGSRKYRDSFTFSKQELDKMRQMAVMAKDFDLVSKFTPKKDLGIIKKELISSIKAGVVDEYLWSLYVDAASSEALVPVNRSPSQAGSTQGNGNSPHGTVALL